MPYQSTPGLPADVIFEIVARVHDVAQGTGIDFRRHRIGLYKQVLITLILLRQNMSQMEVYSGACFGLTRCGASDR